MNDKIAYQQEFAKKYLIPFYGVTINANILKDPARIFWQLPSDSIQPVWVLPLGAFQTSKEVSDCLSEFEFIEGRVNDGTAEGRTYWTSPIGVILLQKKDDPDLREEDLRQTQQFDGWKSPKLEWLIDVLEREVFLQYAPSDSIERIKSYTDAAVEARRLQAIAEEESRRLEEVAREEARLEKRKKLLTDVGSPITDETLALAKEVMGFDVYYDYSDDHRYCISYRAYERDLRAKLKALGMEAMLDNYIRSVVNRTA